MGTGLLLSQEFLQQQRERLEASRDTLLAGMQSGAAEDLQRSADAATQAEEVEDSAQTQADLESGALLRERLGLRLAAVERALAKLDAGHYGYSDVTGRRITTARLEAEPEAASTVEEAQA